MDISQIFGGGPRPRPEYKPDTSIRRREFAIVKVTDGFALELPSDLAPISVGFNEADETFSVLFCRQLPSVAELEQLTAAQEAWDAEQAEFAAAQERSVTAEIDHAIEAGQPSFDGGQSFDPFASDSFASDESDDLLSSHEE